MNNTKTYFLIIFLAVPTMSHTMDTSLALPTLAVAASGIAAYSYLKDGQAKAFANLVAEDSDDNFQFCEGGSEIRIKKYTAPAALLAFWKIYYVKPLQPITQEDIDNQTIALVAIPEPELLESNDDYRSRIWQGKGRTMQFYKKVVDNVLRRKQDPLKEIPVCYFCKDNLRIGNIDLLQRLYNKVTF